MLLEISFNDPDREVIAYSLVNDFGLFSIDGSGVVRFASSPTTDVVVLTPYILVVKAVDMDDSPTTATLTFTVNVDSAPDLTFDSVGGAISVPENRHILFDADASSGVGDVITYSLSGADSVTNEDVGLFTIDSESGRVSLLSGGVFDFESLPDDGVEAGYHLTIIAESSGGASAEQSVVFTVTDLPMFELDGESVASLAEIEIMEGTGVILGLENFRDLGAVDYTGGYTITSGRGVSGFDSITSGYRANDDDFTGKFEIVSGRLQLKSGVSFDYDESLDSAGNTRTLYITLDSGANIEYADEFNGVHSLFYIGVVVKVLNDDSDDNSFPVSRSFRTTSGGSNNDRHFGTVHSDKFIISGGVDDIFAFEDGDILDFRDFSGISSVSVVVSGGDVRFSGSGSSFSFDITLHDVLGSIFEGTTSAEVANNLDASTNDELSTIFANLGEVDFIAGA